MTDGETDTYTYWRRMCNICEQKFPDSYKKCGRTTGLCKHASDIDVYTEEQKYT